GVGEGGGGRDPAGYAEPGRGKKPGGGLADPRGRPRHQRYLPVSHASPFHNQRIAAGVATGAVCSHDPIRRAAAKLAQAAVATSVSSPAGPGQVRASSRTWASTW